MSLHQYIFRITLKTISNSNTITHPASIVARLALPILTVFPLPTDPNKQTIQKPHNFFMFYLKLSKQMFKKYTYNLDKTYNIMSAINQPTSRILPRFKIASIRGSHSRCQICGVKFQMLVKQEHQCKRCFRSVCEVCGPEKKLVYESDGTKGLHRNCLVCIKQGEWIEGYIKKNKLCFGQDSQFVEDWVNKLNKERISYDQITDQYSDIITSETNDNIIRFKRESQQIFQELLESYNYSIRHFLQLITENINPISVRNKVKNVVIGIYGKIKELSYIPQIVYLCIFFLCFANQFHTYFLITRLIERIYPQYIRVKRMKKDNLLSSSLKIIMEMYRICVERVDRNELEVLAQYLEARFSKYITSFTLNMCSVQNSFLIIDDMLKTGNYLPLFKGIAGMLSNCRGQILIYKTFEDVEIPLLREVSLEKTKLAFVKFQKSDAQFQISNEVFDSAEHRKLHEKFKQIESLYNKSEKTLSEKEKIIKDLMIQLTKRKTVIDSQRKRVIELQEQIVSISNHIPQLVDYQNMKENYQKMANEHEVLSQKFDKSQKVIQKLEKEKFSYEKNYNQWKRMEEDHLNSLVEMKTKIQILQIQIAAKDIDFNTSSIERKIKDKNAQINMLQNQIKQLKSEAQYYKLKSVEQSLNAPFDISRKINHENKAQKQEKKLQFDKHIKISKDVIANLKEELQTATKTVKQQADQIQTLLQKQSKLERELQNSQQISGIIKQIPQQFEYTESLQQLEHLIEKQKNQNTKRAMEQVSENYRKCQKQLKYRIMDCRIKELRIKNSPLLQILNPDKFMQTAKQNEAKSEEFKIDDITKLIEQNDTLTEKEEEKKDCLIM